MKTIDRLHSIPHTLTPRNFDWGSLTREEEIIISKIRTKFFTSVDREWFLAPTRNLLDSLKEPFTTLAKAFVANLTAVIEVATLPLTFASARAYDLRFQQLHMAERIRHIPLDVLPPQDDAHVVLTPEQEDEAYHGAREAFQRELGTEEAIRRLGLQTFSHLATSIEDSDSNLAAIELLRQSTVLTWGAFEVLSRDLFAALVNQEPTFAQALAAHSSTKARFVLKAIDITEIAARDFDLSHAMGDILISVADLSDLALIKDTYAVLFPDNSTIRERLAEKNLWMLFQRRHLIVHRRGVVDQQYLSKTADDAPLGTALEVLPTDLGSYLYLVRDAGNALLTATASHC